MRIVTKTVVLTAAQVNALDSGDINILPAPAGSDQMIIIEEVILSKLSGTAAGTCSTAPIVFVYTGDTTAICGFASAANTQTFLSTGTAAASYLTVTKKPAVDGVARTGTIALAKGVDISGAGATIAAFDGTLQVTVTFKVVTIG